MRSQGAPGVVAAARKYLRALRLDEFSVDTRTQFEKALDKHTQKLMKRFPEGAHSSWGGARKALNIFLRDVVYCRPLCTHYRLSNLEPWLELPLDSNSYNGLTKDAAKGQVVPKWPGVKHLKPRVSAELQGVAEVIAKRLQTSRVHLDIKYWRKEAIDDLHG